MIILMLLSQYFHNKCYMASCNWFLFGLIINITFYLPLTTCHLHFVINFLWKFCVLNIIKKKSFSFAPLLKIYMYILCGTLAYFTVDSKMKLFFHALFFLHKQKITLLLQPIYLYLHLWFFPILFISFSLFCIFLVFLFIWSNCLINTQ